VPGQPGSVLLHASSSCQHWSNFCFRSNAESLLPAIFLQHCLACSRQSLDSDSYEASTGGQEAVGWDGQLGGNPTWPPSTVVLTVCGCHAAGNKGTSVARFGPAWANSGWTAAAAVAFHSYACSLVHSEFHSEFHSRMVGTQKLFASTCTYALLQSPQHWISISTRPVTVATS
jgi:hypothetical protein